MDVGLHGWGPPRAPVRTKALYFKSTFFFCTFNIFNRLPKKKHNTTATMGAQNQWRMIEIGRVCLVTKGKYANKVVVILDVVDQNRILVDSPVHADSGIWFGVPRHVMTLKDIEPTPVLAKVPRGARLSTLKKALEEQKTAGEWAALSWAKKLVIRDARANITDFDRVQLDRARRQRAFALRKSFAAKLTKAGKVAKAKTSFKQ